MPVVLSYSQAGMLLDARREGRALLTISPDLGLTTVDVAITPEHVLLPGGQELSWSQVQEIYTARSVCFALDKGDLRKIQAFSEDTNRLCSLMPTSGAPTLLLAGSPMHRIKGTDPYRDTQSKLKAIAPVVGRVLDTATGLGYTVIEACRTANEVITVELDPAVLSIARDNPWSSGLFDNPKITQLVGDSTEVITEFPDGSFTRVVHDPPTISLAGDLYSGAFYEPMYRVLRRGGVCFTISAIWTASWGIACRKGLSAV